MEEVEEAPLHGMVMEADGVAEGAEGAAEGAGDAGAMEVAEEEEEEGEEEVVATSAAHALEGQAVQLHLSRARREAATAWGIISQAVASGVDVASIGISMEDLSLLQGLVSGAVAPPPGLVSGAVAPPPASPPPRARSGTPKPPSAKRSCDSCGSASPPAKRSTPSARGSVSSARAIRFEHAGREDEA